MNQANSYTGQTTISAGTLQLNNGGTLGGQLLTPVVNNSVLVVNQSGTVTQGTNFPWIIGGTGSLVYSGGGTLVLTGTNNYNSYTGLTTASAGTISLASNLAIQQTALDTSGTGVFTLSGSTPTFGGLSGSNNLASVIASGYSGEGGVAALTLNPISGTVTYNGVVADGASGMTLTKIGAGTQVLTGSNSYTGQTILNAGTLTLSGSGSILGSAGITLSGGGLTLTNAAAETGSGRVADAAPITANGGTLTYNNTSGSPVYAETVGTVTLASGPLNIVEAVSQAARAARP